MLNTMPRKKEIKRNKKKKCRATLARVQKSSLSKQRKGEKGLANYLTAEIGAGARQLAGALLDGGDVEAHGAEAGLESVHAAAEVAHPPAQTGHVRAQQLDLGTQPGALGQLLAGVVRA